MRSISDEELDKVFREANEKVTYPFNPDAWAQMSSRLDKPSYWDRIRGLWPFGVLLFVIPVGLVIWNLGNPSASQTEPVNSPVGKLETVDQPFEASTVPQLEVATAHRVGVDQSRKSMSTDLRDDQVDLQSHSESPQVTAHDPESPAGKSTIRQLSVTSVAREVDINKGGNVVESGSLVDTDADTEDHVGVSAEDTRSATGQFSEATGLTSDISAQNLRQTEVLKDDTSESSAQGTIEKNLIATTEDSLQIERTNDLPGKWGLRLQLSPDFTSVPGSGPDKPGINIGLTIDYSINSNFVVSTGAIYTRKKYTGYDLEYEYNSRKYTADEVFGDCRMLDIPINLYYRFNTKGNLRLFVGAGVSSYILFSEDYTYFVNTGYGQRVINQSVTNENRSLFSQLNLSVGLEKRLKPNLAFQIEPFLKAPLSGVGEGQVGLASYGAFFTMKYYFKK